VRDSAKRERELGGHVGPYLPLLLEACAESESAMEYRHGTESHGAFTFNLVEEARRHKAASWEALMEGVQQRLHRLGYSQQHPAIVGPQDRTAEGAFGGEGVAFSAPA
jgi:hypothetical protein